VFKFYFSFPPYGAWVQYHFSVLLGKGKVLSPTGNEGPEAELTYSSILSLTSALDGVGGQRHALAALPPGKTHCIGD